MSTKDRPFKKGDQILWRGKIAKITNDVMEIEGVSLDLRLECDDGEVLTVSPSELLSHPMELNEQEQDRLPTTVRPSVSLSADDANAQPLGGALAISDAQIASVLQCVGRNEVPDALDREELKKDINAAWDFYRGYKGETSKSGRTKLQKGVNEILEATNEYIGIIDASELDTRKSISRKFPLDELRGQLNLLAQCCVALCNAHSNPSSMREVIQATPTDYFLGHDLPGIFEKHFKQPANRTRNSREASLEGPFIRFAVAVSTALGRRFAEETVSKAMTKIAQLERTSANS